MSRYRTLLAVIRRRTHALIEILSLNNGDNLALLGYYQDGISYYATETGSETTDKTLFHIGTGNSDNELDLDMGAVTLTMDTPPANPALDTDYAISGTYSYVSEIEIHARVSPSGSWVTIDSSGITLVEGVWSGNIQIPSTDFTVGDSVEIRVRDAELVTLEDSAVVEVASGVMDKVQITTVDCDFYCLDVIEIQEGRYAIGGFADLTGENPTIAGVDVSKTNPADDDRIFCCIIYDLADGVLAVKNRSTRVSAIFPSVIFGDFMTRDDNYLYFLCLFSDNGGTGTSGRSETIIRIKISDYSMTFHQVFAGTSGISWGSSAIHYFDGKLYCCVGSPSWDRTFKIVDTSNMEDIERATVTATFNIYSGIFIKDDGTDIYVVGRTGSDVAVYKLNEDPISFTLQETLADFFRVQGCVNVGSRLILSCTHQTDSGQDSSQDGITDLTTTVLNATGTKLYLNNSILTRGHTTGTKHNLTTLAVDWTKDYTDDDALLFRGVWKANNKYYLIAHTEGDFDGNHEGNTNRNAIIAEIDIENGDIL